MKKIIIIAKILITFLFCQDIYIINNLIEKEGTFYNYMSDKPISGILYFNYEISKNNFKRLFVGNLENGIKNGLWIRYWDNGLKKSEGIYQKSLKQGIWVEWQENGSKYLEILYKNDSIVHFTNCLKDNCN